MLSKEIRRFIKMLGPGKYSKSRNVKLYRHKWAKRGTRLKINTYVNNMFKVGVPYDSHPWNSTM